MQVVQPTYNQEFDSWEELNTGVISLEDIEYFGYSSDDCDPYDMIGVSHEDLDDVERQVMVDKGWL